MSCPSKYNAEREYGELCPGRQSAGETRTQTIGSEGDVMAVSDQVRL